MRLLVLVVIVAAAACATAPQAVGPPSARPACVMPDGDRAWIDRALEAWRFTSREITGIGSVPNFKAILFSADCVPSRRASKD